MEPTSRRARIEGLDTLRGVAVLGIFMMNVQAFAMVPMAYQNPSIGPMGGTDTLLWHVADAFFMQKFVTIFSALFGAGIVLMMGLEKDAQRRNLHLRRMGWLLLFGVLHWSFIWFGDILMLYAICGLIVFGMRRMGLTSLTVLGLMFFAIGSALNHGASTALYLLPESAQATALAFWSPSPEDVQAEAALYAAPYFERIAETWGYSAGLQAKVAIGFLPAVIGIMLWGMALFKSGFLKGEWKASTYAVIAVLAPLAAAVSWWTGDQKLATGFDFLDGLGAMTIHYWVAPLQSLGYAAIVYWIIASGVGRALMTPFRAAGRMAFTNYIACSVGAALIYYGPPGLGLIGEVDRTHQLIVVLAFWAVILVVSPLWLAVFRYGPLEWLWRTLSYGKLQPFLKG